MTEVFLHSIYCELAEQYKIMDAASNVAKRNVLAEHLKDVIDVLEKKVSHAHSALVKTYG